jgi:predicted methyltransferase
VNDLVVISHFEAQALLEAKHRGLPTAHVSLDLGLTTTPLLLEESGVPLPGGQVLSWEVLENVRASDSQCFVIENNATRPIQFYSQETERVYSLYPTGSAPTMLVSGIPMHRIKDTDPHQDTLEKIRAARPVVGQVLDTATGLGYTAIQAAQTAAHVTTVELDPAALQVARLNPWSQALFDNPKITQVIGDSFEVVAGMEDASFTRILHDPPAFSLAGDLYSGEFYRQLHRVLRNHGIVFHYVGDPESKSGRSITAGVIRRLEQAGFRQVRRAPRAFGVTAVK